MFLVYKLTDLFLYLNTGFLGFCQDKIQGHSSTIEGLNSRIQGLSERGQMNLLMSKLNVLINMFASVVDKCRY